MRPKIEATKFGSITVGGQRYKHDVLLRLDGSVVKRKKKLSKRQFGTSHIISADEAMYVYEEGAESLIVGTGQFDSVRLSEEAAVYFQAQGCQVTLAPTSEVAGVWNQAQGRVIGLFHVTC